MSKLNLNTGNVSITRPVLNNKARWRSGDDDRTKLCQGNESFFGDLLVKDLTRITQGAHVAGQFSAVRFGLPAEQIHACKVLLKKVR